MIKTGSTKNLKDALTPSSYTILKEEMADGHFVRDFSEFEKNIIYNLRLKNVEALQKLPDVSEGLENLLKKAAYSCNKIDDLIKIIISKRYTETRIRRILLYSLLDITKKEMDMSKRTTPYVRVLGFNNSGKELLSKIKLNNPNLKIVTSVKKFMDENTNRNLNLMLKKDILATNVYTIGYLRDSIANMDYTKKIVDKS